MTSNRKKKSSHHTARKPAARIVARAHAMSAMQPRILTTSRKRNTFNLKTALRTRRSDAKRIQTNLQGIEKRRAALSATLDQLSTAVEAVTAAAQASHIDTNVLVNGTPDRIAALSSGISKTNAALTTLVSKVGMVQKELKREDKAVKEARSEMKRARRSVGQFMTETIRFVNDIAVEVTMVQPDMLDDLRAGRTAADGDPHLISSFLRTRTRPRTAPASDIVPKRRGVATRRPKVSSAKVTSTTAKRGITARSKGTR